MKKTIITLVSAISAVAFSSNMYAQGSPECAQLVNKTDQVITLDVGNSEHISKTINIGNHNKSDIFRAAATRTNPEIVFEANTKRKGNISGEITVFPGGVELTKSGNISIQYSNQNTPNCDVSYLISVYK
jgi:hypothetical protein